MRTDSVRGAASRAPLAPLAAACSTGGPASGATASPLPAARATPTSTPTSAPTSEPTPAPGAAGAPRCHPADLAASFRPLSPGAGQRYAALVLANHSDHACMTFGYVGMQLTDRGGQPLPTRVVRAAQPAPARVDLAPNAYVHTLLRWTAIAGPGEPRRPTASRPRPRRRSPRLTRRCCCG